MQGADANAKTRSLASDSVYLDVMIRIFAPALAGVLLTACATTSTPEATSIEAIQAARMADLLTETAEIAPERLRAAQGEMAALERALTTLPTREAAPEPSRSPTMALAPAPDLSGSTSLLSAVHLASYREYDNLVAGWAELQNEAPATLGDMQVRVSEVDLGERGVFLRLKAGPLDTPAAARAVCAELEAAGRWCMPADYTGAHLRSAAD